MKKEQEKNIRPIHIWWHILPIILVISLEMSGHILKMESQKILANLPYYLFDIGYFYLVAFGYMPLIITLLQTKKTAQQLLAALAIPVYGILLILYNGLICVLKNDKFEIPMDTETIQRSSLRGIMICALAYAVAYARNAIKIERKSNRQKLYALQLENNLLSAQTNPHLINNVLNYIYERIQDTNPKEAKAIAMLCEMTSDALMETDANGNITVAHEIEYIKKYLILNALYMEKQPFRNIRIDIGDYENEKLPPKILLEPIVNLLKYGDLTNEEYPAYVNISIPSGELFFRAFNIKRTVGQVPSHKFGLKNMRQRLDTNYPDRYTLEILDLNESFELTLTIKLC